MQNKFIWTDRDLLKVAVFSTIAGLIIGFLIGYEVAWEPVITTFRPLIG